MAKRTTSDFKTLSHNIKQKNFVPVYLLQGDEPYYIDQITKLLEDEVLQPHEKSFNFSILYGKDVNMREVIMAAKRYPMMSERQLIIVKEAQNIRKESWDDLIPYLENPLHSTLLVFALKNKKLDQRTKVYKLLNSFSVFNSDKLYENEIPNWIQSYLKEKNLMIDEVASQLISDFLGSDLAKIASAIDTMLINIPPQVKLINSKHIEEHIGINKDFTPFELTKALSTGDFKKAIQVVTYLGNNDSSKGNLLMILATLNGFFSKVLMFHDVAHKTPKDQAVYLGVSPFFVRDYKQAATRFSRDQVAHIMGLLKYFDLASKGVLATSADSGAQMRDLVIKIFNSKG